MALFFDCWKSRGATLERLQQLLDDAEDQAETERKAATHVQRLFRGQRVRAAVTAQTDAELMISRVYRGHLARRRCKRLRADTERAHRRAVLDFYAVVIQKLARGVQSRTLRLDFRKRKAYIGELAAKGDHMRRMLDENLRKQQQQEQLDSAQAAREELVKVTQDLHHLLSTRAVAGIYNSPMQPATATSFGVPVETHIRENARRVVTSRLAATRLPSRLTPYPPSNKSTLQATAPYDAVQQESRKQTKYHKLRRIGSSDFAAVYNSEQDVARKRNAPGVNAGIEYLDDWRNPYKKRGVPRSKRDLLPQLSTLGQCPETPFYLTYGGNKSKVLANDRFDV
ncbi:spermatogenesis-associated protein 17 [Phytophthora pseudosyringae]|uniref:Spermatogenesis-associated protein 17 n=1 Tax=Phytophthora pseudosyringae TaxID=221518 RepID=A0A8T1W3H6_9STRA|nr:spermatogenesis-associated protein 17 [Phytophthora pseudosyringae]